MVQSQWRKSATWFALNRKHSLVFVNEKALEKGWESVPCCDEHYLPSILAYYNLDNETTCSDGFSHVLWDSHTDSHPHLYSNNEIGAQLFAKFKKPISDGPGFSQLCSGSADLCHFTARKFGGHSRLTLLENIHLILDDEASGIVYSNDQWEHYQTRLRIVNGSYFLSEDLALRRIPNLETLAVMHLNASTAVHLNDHEAAAIEHGPDYPSRMDGQLYKMHKDREIFLISGNVKRAIPDMDTFNRLGLHMKNVVIVTRTYLEEIPLGLPLPSNFTIISPAECNKL